MKSDKQYRYTTAALCLLSIFILVLIALAVKCHNEIILGIKSCLEV